MVIYFGFSSFRSLTACCLFSCFLDYCLLFHLLQELNTKPKWPSWCFCAHSGAEWRQSCHGTNGPTNIPAWLRTRDNFSKEVIHKWIFIWTISGAAMERCPQIKIHFCSSSLLKLSQVSFLDWEKATGSVLSCAPWQAEMVGVMWEVQWILQGVTKIPLGKLKWERRGILKNQTNSASENNDWKL